jgi:uncharacterized hydrophobic protein (TIGR00271 family)
VAESPLAQNQRGQIVSSLIEGANLNANFITLTVASCAIATFGLLENSAAVIIGAMIIAPLMTVIQATAYGALEGEARVFWRSVLTLSCGIIIAAIFSALLAKIVGLSEFGNEILSRTRPNLIDLGIALAAGTVGAFARVRPAISNTLAGTAIAVALMPPLCVVGIGLAGGDWQTSRGAMLLFLTNLLGITLASMVVFLLAGFARRRARSALVLTGALTALIVVPLALSLQTLVREAALENALRRALTTQTVTFRQATLVSSRFDWLSRPPTATLLVRSSVILSPHQVALLEAFARRETGQVFQLDIDVTHIERVIRACGAQPLSVSRAHSIRVS